MKIAVDTFHRTGLWIKRNARPLEAARWGYYFENTSSEQVIHYLSAFQNDDGGFGHGIEPDFWLPLSSPMATWAAGQVLMEIGADPEEEVVQSMLTYLANSVDEKTGMWSAVLPENNDYPHAPWWHWQEGVQQNWLFNPGAELAGFLVHWSPEGSEYASIGWRAAEKAVEHVMESTEMDFHQVSNFQQLLKIMLNHQVKFDTTMPNSFNEVMNKVMNLTDDCIEKDESEWATGYKPLPLDLIDDQEHPLFEKYRDLIEENIEFYVEQMTEDGIWNIPWEWGTYPEKFPVAERYWQGILAVNRYKVLRAFGSV
ncbi:hypothetical protein GMD78_06085 [Ornithinibacillus sp. L9]|uniref:Uncharacterized protein n=1 Tax=Ornithinibacillus caprae TaxID=2678566 RepID=A0A6N8FGZ8_9BACI|nr:hypothetical protein [Ornithinibacillus caprae]MUK87966.1 hypothetical protein [Ornithinibacillus caprae]